ncbi:MAG: DNA-processing protein DprA [Thermodesulfobacteriota bacterium]|jgi:predicted Rossmann fold nucleotide-binding protein DprA/Smf involved in DNA uptake|nr:MAG: DNA-processing protein DprA [Thermodesulfobacteriota bacterium]
MNILQIKKGESGYPLVLAKYLGNQAPESISVIGDFNILNHQKLAIFCSVKCPGNLILQTYDLAQKLREDGITVISGFHSPIEQECLRLLLRGEQPIILCLARSIEGLRIRREYRGPLAEGRLLILSPFTANQPRPTVAMSLYRNYFVAALSNRIFVPYAAPSSKTENFCNEILTCQKLLYTFENDFNQNLIFRGAHPISLEKFSAFS